MHDHHCCYAGSGEGVGDGGSASDERGVGSGSDVAATEQVMRKGSDITLVGWGAQLSVMEHACEEASKEGISCELIDLRTLIPWDKELIEASVNKTGRLLVRFGPTFRVSPHCFLVKVEVSS